MAMDNRVEKIIDTVRRLRDFNHDISDLSAVKLALDGLFLPDAKCVNFIYTINNDKLPFGCIVMPNMDSSVINNFIVNGDPVRFTEYSIELDSKVFDYGLTDEEVVSIMIYNIYHMVSDMTPAKRVREMIDAYLTNTGTNIILRDSIQYEAILAFGLYDALNQLTSALFLPDAVESDLYLESLGLDCFKDGIKKLYKEIPGCENEVLRQPRLSMLHWALRLYCNIKEERIPAIHLLGKSKSIVASVLYIQKMNSVINALNRIDTDFVANESCVTLLKEAKRGFFAGLRYNGLRDIENDLYEFVVRAKNAETEEEVMYALKQINARLAILDDYIRANQDDPDVNHWIGVKEQYMAIRDKMAKSKVYNKKQYGIFVDYNKLDDLDDDE